MLAPIIERTIGLTHDVETQVEGLDRAEWQVQHDIEPETTNGRPVVAGGRGERGVADDGRDGAATALSRRHIRDDKSGGHGPPLFV